MIPIIITKKLRNITKIFKDKDDVNCMTKNDKKFTITPKKEQIIK